MKSRFCCLPVAVLVFVVVAGHDCRQKERTLAGLDQAEDSLRKARDLYPDCEDDKNLKNSSECSKTDKSLGFLEVALDLVLNAKKNFPVCKPEIENPPMDCQDVLASGHVGSGVYSVWPRSREVRGKAVLVRCDMNTDGGGWTVIQRRGNFSPQENFHRNWQDYKNGFGNLSRDFWIGNDNIFALSNQGAYSLRLDMTAADGSSAYDVFREFWILDENSNYKLHLTGHSGTAGNSMTVHNGYPFSTADRKNDKHNCVKFRKGGFWFNACDNCNPNGQYKAGPHGPATMNYYTFKKYESLFSIEMKIKRM